MAWPLFMICKVSVYHCVTHCLCTCAGGATPEQIEDVVDIILGESELAYPVLYQVAVGEIAPAEAAKLTLIAHQAKPNLIA